MMDNEEKASADDKLDGLRRLMKDVSVGLDFYVVPSTDAHASEFIASCDRRLAFISGFTGSSGTAVISRKKAWLFTDSRYWIQAAQQLNSNLWELRKIGVSKSHEGDDWRDWIVKNAPKDAAIGIDPSLLAALTAEQLSTALAAKSRRLVYPDDNLIDRIWTSRPPRSDAPLVLHPLRFSGRPALSKIGTLKDDIVAASSHARGYVTSKLSDIMWLLNIRGGDIPFNPFVFSHLWVSVSSEAFSVLFVEPGKVDQAQRSHLLRLGVTVRDYTDVTAFLAKSPDKPNGKSSTVVADLTLSESLARAIRSSGSALHLVRSPIERAKALKNEIELDGLRAAYRRDAVAWAKWAAWMKKTMRAQRSWNKEKRASQGLTEWEAAERLTGLRERLENYAGLAYENISATNENAALPHYAPSKHHSRVIDCSTPYLNDSGPQYLDGTIDNTRTYHFGLPTTLQKRAYTAVLKGHIAAATCKWPESSGVNGLQLDAVARLENCKLGFGYGHGTGHGVGSYLGVHEGPQGLGPSPVWAETPLQAGHVVSIEPGYYREGEFGLRIESIYAVVEVANPQGLRADTHRGEDERWLGFERLTQVPIATNLIDFGMMTPQEIQWLRKHNAECLEAVTAAAGLSPRSDGWLSRLKSKLCLGPLIDSAEDGQMVAWLKSQCKV